MQERFPELPKADTTALAEMRTLGQIVESCRHAAVETHASTTGRRPLHSSRHRLQMISIEMVQASPAATSMSLG